ncbi:MAG TPA: penicillin acylase family protein [Turneriella sp.]|nr:penicillin acylase family protein [Turneriella sp.]
MKTPLRTDANGIPHLEASDPKELFYQLGVAHAAQRSVQTLLMRILGEGRGSELLDNSDTMLGIDKFFRRMNWTRGLDAEVHKLSGAELAILNAYCDGINSVLAAKLPWEFKLLGLKFEKWLPEHSILIARMMGYLTLSQSQAEVEKLFIELVQAGADKGRLAELFPGLLAHADLSLIKEIDLEHRITPPEYLWQLGLPRMMASNNWVIAGSRTQSKKPILSNDPHLEGNRLPNVWHEFTWRCGDRSGAGAGVPGLPGMMVGRNDSVAWGATYTFMDAVDSWIEKCRDEKFLDHDKKWKSFELRREVIKRKKKPDAEVVFYENKRGTLEGNASGSDEKLMLTTAWSGAQAGAASIRGALAMPFAKSAKEGMQILGNLEVSFSWVLADNAGNIGYQMSGLMPKRRNGWKGFVPVPAWKKNFDWQGFAKPAELPRRYNPKEGFIVTANNDLNSWGKQKPINMPMGNYRARRIAQLLTASKKHTVAGVQQQHYDTYSLQAEEFMKILKPMLGNSAAEQALAAWDMQYTPESFGAGIFEAWYRALYSEVFGATGKDAAQFMWKEGGIFIDFYQNFDRILLAKKSAWFGSREDIYKAALERIKNLQPHPWGETNRFVLRHLLFGGKFPRFMGFDHGPIPIRGGRATVHQGQIYRSAGRDTSFIPTFRFVTDFSERVLYSNLLGGPSDRRFGKFYRNEVDNWLNGVYKKLEF